jgi:flavin reductase (DIM6/NTAB) family NADH-FMN oxidoreductase RutF
MSSVQQIFTELTGGLDYPMLVVTATSEGQRAGCLVGFSTHCSIDPPRFIVCLSDKNHTRRVAERSDALAVHFLASDALELARLFGSETGDEIDKFSRCRWHPGPFDLPILDDCHRWFVGEILERQKLGDHVAFVVNPLAANNEGSTDTLTFSQVKHLDPGHDA